MLCLHDKQVRRQSHVCLRDVLLSFQGTAILAPASEAIANIFERFLLLAGGSNANPSEGPKGAQEVLYILDALRDCLPLMSLKSSTNILKYYKSLLELHQPLVTRRITDGLNVLCRHQKGEVSAEMLLDLLGLLAASMSTNETSADSMTFTARLLDAGMKKVYLMNRQICVVKLPVVFSGLAGLTFVLSSLPIFLQKSFHFFNIQNNKISVYCILSSIYIQKLNFPKISATYMVQ